MIEGKRVDHRDPDVAARIHAVQMAAYAQEARLIGARQFPPLEITVHDIQVSDEQYFAAFDDDSLVGVVSIEPDEDSAGKIIASLVVDPARQREGIASRLMQIVVEEFGSGRMTVQTAVKNLPALAFYAKFGFVECRRWVVGEEALELVQLQRKGE